MKLFKQRLFFEKAHSLNKLGVSLLMVTAFFECIISPITPLLFLFPLCIKYPSKWMYFVVWTTVFSVMGALLGYVFGGYLFEWIIPIIERFEWQEGLAQARQLYLKLGVFALFISSFTFIPFKFFAILSGVLNFPIYQFIFFTIIARFTHFLTVPLVILLYKHGKGKWIRFKFRAKLEG